MTRDRITPEYDDRLKLRRVAIKSAIKSWNDKASGVYHWSEKQRYSKKHCLNQIEFFQNMLKKSYENLTSHK